MVFGILALAPLLQFQGEVTVGRRLFEVIAVARDERVDAQLREVFDSFLDLFQYVISLLQAASGRGLYINKYCAHVFVWHEAALRGSHHPEQGYQRGDNKDSGKPTARDKGCYGPLVMAEHGIEARVETGVEASSLGIAHEYGAESRREGKSVEERYANGDGHGKTELRIECTCDAPDEADRNKHRHEDKSGCDKGGCDAMHSLLYNLRFAVGHLAAWICLVYRFDFGLNRLDNNNSIIYNRSDDEDEGKEGEHVQGETDGVDYSQGGHE